MWKGVQLIFLISTFSMTVSGYANVYGQPERVLNQDLFLSQVIGKVIRFVDGVEVEQCTGVVVGTNQVASDRHCFIEEQGFGDLDQITLKEGQYFFILNSLSGTTDLRSKATIKHVSLTSDLGTLRVALPNNHPVLEVGSPHIGGNYLYAGFGLDFWGGQRLSVHKSCSVLEYLSTFEVFLHNCHTVSADSGGAILHVTFKFGIPEYKLVGLHTVSFQIDGKYYYQRYHRDISNAGTPPQLLNLDH